MNSVILKKFIDKFGEEIGIKKYKYSNSLECYILRYGEKLGKEKYNLWCKSQDHGSITFFIKKYGKDKGTKKYIDACLKKNLNRPKSYFSKISQKLFKQIKSTLKDSTDMLFATNGSELRLYYTENNMPNRYCYDFAYKNKIIEYNGDWFHRNPLYYDPLLKENKLILNRDAKKLELAKSRGFEVLVVWDSEYKLNPEAVLKKCIAFLKNAK